MRNRKSMGLFLLIVACLTWTVGCIDGVRFGIQGGIEGAVSGSIEALVESFLDPILNPAE